MLIQELQRITDNYEGTSPLYLRTLLKEYIQDYILNFIYTDSSYKNFIFTGGTCLRKVYGLNRLSEDLDFDYEKEFDIDELATDLRAYLVRILDFEKVRLKIANNERSAILKFDVLEDIGLASTPADPKSLFVRCDFALEEAGGYGESVNSISTSEFTFFARCYDLETLYANKIIVFLERSFYTGGKQEISFKGRDVYDLVWFKEYSLRQGFEPNAERLRKKADLSVEEAWEKVRDKVEKIDSRDVYRDIVAFLPNESAARSFADGFKGVLLG